MTICEYCAKPFTVEDPANHFLLKVKEKEKELEVCSACYGALLSVQDTMCGASAQTDITQVKLFKIVSYSFSKEPVGKKDFTRGLPASLRKSTQESRALLTTSKPELPQALCLKRLVSRTPAKKNLLKTTSRFY